MKRSGDSIFFPSKTQWLNLSIRRDPVFQNKVLGSGIQVLKTRHVTFQHGNSEGM